MEENLMESRTMFGGEHSRILDLEEGAVGSDRDVATSYCFVLLSIQQRIQLLPHSSQTPQLLHSNFGVLARTQMLLKIQARSST
jgi:hypothetical protein